MPVQTLAVPGATPRPLLYSGSVYTMDHEVVPWRSKSADWLLKLSQDNFGLHLRKNGRGTMKVEVPNI